MSRRRRRHRRGRRRRRRRFLTPRKPNNLERLAMCARWQTSTMNVNHIIKYLIDYAVPDATWTHQP